MGERASRERSDEVQDDIGAKVHETEESPAHTQFTARGSIPGISTGDETTGESASDQAFGGLNVSNSLGDWAPKSWKPTYLRKFPKPTEHGGEKTPPPPKYAGMHKGVQDLLWRSQDELPALKAQPKDKDFWDKLDALDPNELQVLVQIMVRSEGAGLGKYISVVKDIYNHGSSWGIHFQSTGNPLRVAMNGKWGKDAIQPLVRQEHGNSAHEWYRQDTGAFNHGLHLGIDDGAGDHNVHVDPTNPMMSVSKGVPVPGPDGLDEILYPFGVAIYHPQALTDHAKEVNAYPSWAPGADKKPVQRPRQSEPWYTLHNLPKDAGIAADWSAEEARSGKAGTAEIHTKIQAAKVAIDGMAAKSRNASMHDHSKDTTELDALKAETDRLVNDFFSAVCDLFKHLYAEGGNAPGKYDPREIGTWIPYAQGRVGAFGGDCRKECLEARKNKKG